MTGNSRYRRFLHAARAALMADYNRRVFYVDGRRYLLAETWRSIMPTYTPIHWPDEAEQLHNLSEAELLDALHDEGIL